MATTGLWRSCTFMYLHLVPSPCSSLWHITPWLWLF